MRKVASALAKRVPVRVFLPANVGADVPMDADGQVTYLRIIPGSTVLY
jgi:hypothetical protein